MQRRLSRIWLVAGPEVRPSAPALAARRILLYRNLSNEFRARLIFRRRNHPACLADKCAHTLHAAPSAYLYIEARRQPHAVIANGELNHLVARAPKPHPDRARAPQT